MLPNRVGCASTFDSFRRYLKHPAKNKRNRQTNNDEHNNQTNYPIRNVEDRKDLRDALGEGPTRDDVRDSNLVNIAPLQFGEEGVDSHSLKSSGFASNAEEYLKSSQFASYLLVIR